MSQTPTLADLEVALDVGAFRPAHTVLEQRFDPRRPPVALLLGRCAFDLGNLTEAERFWEASARETNLAAESNLWLARLRGRQGRAAEAAEALGIAGKAGIAEPLLGVFELIVSLSLGDLPSVTAKRVAKVRDQMPIAAQDVAHPIGQVLRLANNLAALFQWQPEVAKSLGKLRPWDLFTVRPVGDQLIPFRRTGNEGAPIYDGQQLARREVEQLGLFEKSLDVTCPVLLMGVGSGQVVSELFKVKTQHQLPKRLGLFAVVPNLETLGAALLHNDWADGMRRGQAVFLDHNPVSLQRLIEADLRRAPASFRFAAIDLSDSPESANYLSQTQHFLASLADRANRQAAALERHYASEEFRASWRTGKVVRRKILIPSCRYTTFIGYNLDHCASALSEAGHEPVILDESDEPHAWVGPAYVIDQLSRIRPDVYLRANAIRAQDTRLLPRGLPYLTIVQDYIAEHHAGPLPLGPRDFVVAQTKYQFLLRGTPAAQVLGSLVPSLAKVYAAPARGGRSYTCDVAYVSHASKPPAEWIASQLARNPDPGKWEYITTLSQRLTEIYAQGQIPELATWWRLAMELVEEQKGNGASLTGSWPVEFADSLNNMLLRQNVLQWISEAGVDLQIYGNGWDRHPTLARHARGPVDNGAALRDLYRSSRINLQLVGSGNLHQRLIDGLIAGAFFLMPRHGPPARVYLPGDPVRRQQLVAAILAGPIATLDDLKRISPELLDTVNDLQVIDDPAIADTLIVALRRLAVACSRMAEFTGTGAPQELDVLNERFEHIAAGIRENAAYRGADCRERFQRAYQPLLELADSLHGLGMRAQREAASWLDRNASHTDNKVAELASRLVLHLRLVGYLRKNICAEQGIPAEERRQLGDSALFHRFEHGLLSVEEEAIPELAELKFDNREELVAKMNRWLPDDAGREAFSERLQQSSSLHHWTYENAVRRFLAWVGDRIGNENSPAAQEGQ